MSLSLYLHETHVIVILFTIYMTEICVQGTLLWGVGKSICIFKLFFLQYFLIAFSKIKQWQGILKSNCTENTSDSVNRGGGGHFIWGHPGLHHRGGRHPPPWAFRGHAQLNSTTRSQEFAGSHSPRPVQWHWRFQEGSRRRTLSKT